MTVYAVQHQKKWSAERREYWRFDLASTEEFGRLEVLLPSATTPFRPSDAVSTLVEKLSGFSDEDYLLMIGNPILMGMAFAIAAQTNKGRVNALQWSGKRERYVPILIKI